MTLTWAVFPSSMLGCYSPMLLSGNHSYSFTAMTYQMQASQWAASVKENINRVKIMAVCCEYRSIFCNSLARRNRRVNLTRWICDSCLQNHRERKRKNSEIVWYKNKIHCLTMSTHHTKRPTMCKQYASWKNKGEF